MLIEVPPLRERSEDIAPLALHFLKRTCTEFGRDPLHLSHQQVESLRQHNWPGNIRELKNVLERAVILSKGDRLRLDLALPENPQPKSVVSETLSDQPQFVTDAEMRTKEKANIIAALKHVDWQIWGRDGAAELLGVKPSTLTYRIKVFGIRKDE